MHIVILNVGSTFAFDIINDVCLINLQCIWKRSAADTGLWLMMGKQSADRSIWLIGVLRLRTSGNRIKDLLKQISTVKTPEINNLERKEYVLKRRGTNKKWN